MEQKVTAPRLPRLDDIRPQLESLRRHHLIVEDCWYSCPLAVDAEGRSECCNDNAPQKCDCGADAHNARLDKLEEDIAFLLALVEKQREAIQYAVDHGGDYAPAVEPHPLKVLRAALVEGREP